MDTYNWYSQINRPTWSPPSYLFGPVWSFLYSIILISFGAVFYKAYTKKIPKIIVLPFVLNLIFNFLFTPIQFGLKNNLLASVDILLVLATLAWALYSVWNAKHKLRWVFYVNIPYFLWVLFATVLQFTITYLNI